MVDGTGMVAGGTEVPGDTERRDPHEARTVGNERPEMAIPVMKERRSMALGRRVTNGSSSKDWDAASHSVHNWATASKRLPASMMPHFPTQQRNARGVPS
jgi:hypothetical protein